MKWEINFHSNKMGFCSGLSDGGTLELRKNGVLLSGRKLRCRSFWFGALSKMGCLLSFLVIAGVGTLLSALLAVLTGLYTSEHMGSGPTLDKTVDNSARGVIAMIPFFGALIGAFVGSSELSKRVFTVPGSERLSWKHIISIHVAPPSSDTITTTDVTLVYQEGMAKSQITFWCNISHANSIKAGVQAVIS